MTVITPDELEQRGQEFLSHAENDVLLIKSEGKLLGALVSPEDFEIIRQVKAQRVIDAMHALGRHMASETTVEELDDLIRELDTHNS